MEEKYKKAKKTGDLDGFVASWRRCLENRGSGRETSTCIHCSVGNADVGTLGGGQGDEE